MIYDLNNAYKAQCAKEYLSQLIEKKSVIELKQKRVPRKLNQNALYWVWLTAIEAETEQDRNELHFLYRCLFLRKPLEAITAIIKPNVWERLESLLESFIFKPEMHCVLDVVSNKSSELDTKEFTEYLEKIRKHARANFGVILLGPEEANFEAFYREFGFR